ncbi:HAD-IB family hydrolase [Clostridium bovifaecis]|uniref:HAD-IB family hydrolase n=1 Tax=Clostridium bovifaecis TaxID=2184719 RepID=A0A6I6EN05_9CLOT|nr:HAD-IB family hydrolase [Clostridium bovifaecis]
MERLAIFDVDYTLTKRETLIELYLFMVKKNPKLLMHMPKIIMSGILYALKIYDAGRAKRTFIRFLEGIHEKKMKSLVKEFYEERLSKILYKDAIDTMKELKGEGCKVYLISASPEVYLNELYNIKEVDMIIGTRLKIEDGIYKSTFEGENNKGEEKIRRLKEVLKKENLEVDFKNSYMFSDSLADLPLFKLVGNAYLINSRKKYNNVKNLKWS